MIPIEISWFVFLYLFLFLATIFLVWIGFEMRRRLPARESLNGLLTCHQCGMVFMRANRENLQTCPRCGAVHDSLQR